MSVLAAAPSEVPHLVGARAAPTRRAPGAKSRASREQLFPGVPDRVYDEAISAGRNIFGRWLMINDPAGVKRVLVDKVASYPKTAMEQRFFVALFGSGLVGSDGDLWRRHRRIMAPSFDPRSVAAYAPAMTDSAHAMRERWQGLGEGAEVEMVQEMVALTLQIICRTMFSTDSEEMAGTVSSTMQSSLAVVGDVNILDIVPVISEMRMRQREKRMAKLFAPFDATVERLVAQREADREAFPADLLSRLVAAKDAESGLTMTGKEVRDEVVTIFAAGHETTAMTMSWLWYLLSQHPAEEARLHGELDTVLAGRAPGQEDLARLPYTRQVVEEAMRLYPAAPGLSSRIALEDDEICGQRIRKGQAVSILPWYLHRNTGLWDEPERFDPDRFSAQRSAGRPRFAYLPFGAGPRVCIGQVLAMNEAVLILASLAQQFTPRLASDAKVVMRHNVTLQPRFGLKMILRRR